MNLKKTIAAALLDHRRGTVNAFTSEWICNVCGEKILPEGTLEEDISAHQAAAVLAVLEEAGTLQWGIRYGDGDIDEGYLFKSEAVEDMARLHDKTNPAYCPETDEPMTLLVHKVFIHKAPWVEVTP